MSDTPRTDSENEYDPTNIDDIKKFASQLERELNATTEERDELKEEVKSLKETILDQESHILELQSRRPFTPGYTAEP
jgi:uncharacterized coiled-coil DUF342 family protein